MIAMNALLVMPAYNEERTIGAVVRKARRYGTVLVINDASSDQTAREARRAGATVVSHSRNKGLGAALQTGFSYALKHGYGAVITIDSDGQHDPDEIPKFLRKIEEGYDFVLGQRDLTNYPFIKKFGNFFLELATNFVSGTRLKDTESGYRALRTEALKKFLLSAERYEVAVEIVYEAGRNKLRCANVPVRSSVYVKGVGVMDGIKNFRYLLRRRKRNWRMYLEDLRTVLKKNI